MVQRPEFPTAVADGSAAVKDEQKHQFLAAALRTGAPGALPRLPLIRFEQLVSDFALLCRREAQDDCLSGYAE